PGPASRHTRGRRTAEQLTPTPPPPLSRDHGTTTRAAAASSTPPMDRRTEEPPQPAPTMKRDPAGFSHDPTRPRPPEYHAHRMPAGAAVRVSLPGGVTA